MFVQCLLSGLCLSLSLSYLWLCVQCAGCFSFLSDAWLHRQLFQVGTFTLCIAVLLNVLHMTPHLIMVHMTHPSVGHVTHLSVCHVTPHLIVAHMTHLSVVQTTPLIVGHVTPLCGPRDSPFQCGPHDSPSQCGPRDSPQCGPHDFPQCGPHESPSQCGPHDSLQCGPHDSPWSTLLPLPTMVILDGSRSRSKDV